VTSSGLVLLSTRPAVGFKVAESKAKTDEITVKFIPSIKTDERKSAIISAVEKTQAFLNSIIKADERKDPWEISRTTEIRYITAHSILEITNFLEALVDEPGSLV
jgi:hypothetical protein